MSISHFPIAKRAATEGGGPGNAEPLGSWRGGAEFSGIGELRVFIISEQVYGRRGLVGGADLHVGRLLCVCLVSPNRTGSMGARLDGYGEAPKVFIIAPSGERAEGGQT